MISNHLLTKVIVQTFEEKVGKWQHKNEVRKAFRKYEKRITGFSGPSFYEVIDVPVELDALA